MALDRADDRLGNGYLVDFNRGKKLAFSQQINSSAHLDKGICSVSKLVRNKL
jgi:hypothetical protein